MMEINSKTILKAILGSIIQLSRAIQFENRIDEQTSRIYTVNLLETEIRKLLNINKDNSDKFLISINKLIQTYKDNSAKYTILLQIRDLYKDLHEKN